MPVVLGPSNESAPRILHIQPGIAAPPVKTLHPTISAVVIPCVNSRSAGSARTMASEVSSDSDLEIILVNVSKRTQRIQATNKQQGQLHTIKVEVKREVPGSEAASAVSDRKASAQGMGDGDIKSESESARGASAQNESKSMSKASAPAGSNIKSESHPSHGASPQNKSNSMNKASARDGSNIKSESHTSDFASVREMFKSMSEAAAPGGTTIKPAARAVEPQAAFEPSQSPPHPQASGKAGQPQKRKGGPGRAPKFIPLVVALKQAVRLYLGAVRCTYGSHKHHHYDNAVNRFSARCFLLDRESMHGYVALQDLLVQRLMPDKCCSCMAMLNSTSFKFEELLKRLDEAEQQWGQRHANHDSKKEEKPEVKAGVKSEVKAEVEAAASTKAAEQSAAVGPKSQGPQTIAALMGAYPGDFMLHTPGFQACVLPIECQLCQKVFDLQFYNREGFNKLHRHIERNAGHLSKLEERRQQAELPDDLVDCNGFSLSLHLTTTLGRLFQAVILYYSYTNFAWSAVEEKCLEWIKEDCPENIRIRSRHGCQKLEIVKPLLVYCFMMCYFLSRHAHDRYIAS